MRINWIFPTFFVGFSVAPHHGFYAIGLGFVSLSYDRYFGQYRGRPS